MGKKVQTLVILMLMCAFTYGQRSITGTVKDQEGYPIIGANVYPLGSTAGSITEVDGSFSLNVPTETEKIVISYVGYSDKEVEIAGKTVFDVILSEGTVLEEIVVNGLGVERNARNVAYANQSISADELLSAPNKNTLEALRGKTAGVKISTASGSVGASTRIVLRGESSLTGNNNALIVVDGVPIDNDASRGGNGAATTGYVDYGNRFNDINPEDIENVTILKGAAATAVYGSRGASGVVVVTTKKGKGKFNVGFSSNFSLDQAYVLLQRQDKFGQGFGGNTFDSGENFAWGPALDGVERPWTSPVDVDGDGTLEFLSRPYSAIPDQLQHFFRTGSTNTNHLSFSGSSDKFSYLASYGTAYQRGILDNTDYKRNSFNLSASAKVSERFKTDFNINYSLIDQNGSAEGARGFDGNNAYAAAIQTPNTVPFQEIRDYKNPFHDLKGFFGSYTGNPYYTLYEFVNRGKINNLLAGMSMTYNLFKGFDVVARIGTNNISRDITTITPQYKYEDQLIWTNNLSLVDRGGRPENPGELVKTNGNNTNFDYTAQGNYKKELSSSLKLNASLGYNRFDRKTRNITGQTNGGFVVPNWYSLSNSVQQSRSSQSSSNYTINGIFGNANLGYKDWLFLDYSARNDWSSTLPQANNSFFYQAIGASAVLTDVLGLQENDYMGYFKLRANYGTTGKDAGLYLLQSSFAGNPVLQSLANGHDLLFPLNGQSGFTQGDFIGNPELKPELTTTTEIGADISFFRDILAVEYTYYNANHSDQIVTINLPSSTGYTNTAKNIGQISNKGHELGLTIRPLGPRSKVKWEMNVNYSKNINEVVKISDQQDELTVGAFPVSLVAKEGLPFGTFKGVVYDRDPSGNLILDPSGNPVLASDEAYLGSYQPDFLAGLSNTLSYKGFTLNFLFDMKQGGLFYSYTKNLSEFNGTSQSSLLNNREDYVIPGVVKNADGSFSPNTKAVSVYDYLLNLPDTEYLVDASYIKFRDLGLRYTFNKKAASKLRASSLTLGIYGRNLKFWLPESNTFADPEVNGPALTGNGVGIETSQTPPSKSYGVQLTANF